MLLLTHLLGSLFFVNLFSFKLSFFDYLFLFLGTVFPDIDIKNSFLGRHFKFINFLFGHRNFFHSLLSLFFFSSLVYLLNVNYAVYFFLGYFFHLVLDSFTFSGISWFYPLKFKIKGFVKTGSLFEKLIFLFFLIYLLWFYFFNF